MQNTKHISRDELDNALRVVVAYATQQYVANVLEEGEELGNGDYIAIHQTACHMLADKIAERMHAGPEINVLFKD